MVSSNMLARQMAENIVNAYLEHDRKAYEKSAKYFADVFKSLFPKIAEDDVLKGAQRYVDALRFHDKIEEGGYSRSEHSNHNGWTLVRNSLLEMCKSLNLPQDYANETAEFFKLHGIRDNNFVVHMLNADRIFTNAITKNGKFSGVLGGLYLACVGGHDMHSDYGVELQKSLISIYYTILLDNMKKKL
jgi:hypothetical protein